MFTTAAQLLDLTDSEAPSGRDELARTKAKNIMRADLDTLFGAV